MARDKGGGFGKVLLTIFFIILIPIGLFILWKALAADGWFKSPEELRAELANKTQENELLQGQLDQVTAENVALQTAQRGIPSLVFWGLLAVTAIFSTMFVAANNGVGGKNINQEQAEKMATYLVAKPENGEWRYFRDAVGHFPVWRRRKPYTGQVVEGDLDALWYVIEFAQDFPVGGGESPDHLCVTVMIKSNDADRQRIIEHGLNASNAAKLHSIKLQRSANPTKLAEELRELNLLGDVSEKISSIREAD